MIRRRLGILICLLAMLSTGVGAQRADTLRGPWVGLVKRIETTPKGAMCKVVPPPKRDVIGVSYYSDSTHHSIVDQAKLAQNIANLNPIRDYLAAVTANGDRAAAGEAIAAVCGLRSLSAWARADALDGKVNRQGEYEREWTVGGLALAYLKIRQTGAADPDGPVIGAWLARLARAIQPFYPPTERNNHDYWAGVAVASSGIAANDRALYDWGIATYRVGVDQITPDGTLPLEMARGRRALHYHLFAIEPLVMLAELGRANGQDLYAMDGNAISRLARRCVSGIEDPSYFSRASGVTQDFDPSHIAIDELAWMEPYQMRFPSRRMLSILLPYRPIIYPRLGGNLTAIYAQH